MPTKKNAAAKKTRKTSSSKTKTNQSKWLNMLPESMEHMEVVKQVANILEDMQGRVSDVKDEANKELKKVMRRYEGKYKSLENRIHKVTTEAKKQAHVGMIELLQKWHEHKEKLPTPLMRKVEKFLEQVATRSTRGKSAAKKIKTPSKPKSTSKKAAASQASKKKKTSQKRKSTTKSTGV